MMQISWHRVILEYSLFLFLYFTLNSVHQFENVNKFRHMSKGFSVLRQIAQEISSKNVNEPLESNYL